MIKRSVNVRTIAETFYEGGDLYAEENTIDRMQEGLKGHLLLQNAHGKEWRCEVAVKLPCDFDGIELTVQGRIDALLEQDGTCLVEEIKTTRDPLEYISEDSYPVHWAQAEIYAHIMCETAGYESCSVRLVYANLSGGARPFTRVYTKEGLKELFSRYCSVYVDGIRKEARWLDVSVPSIRLSPFPFATYREGQRQLAEDTYRAIRDRTRLLCEAPTGIGKTAATLFPAVKALGEGLTDTVFYLTARTTGRVAAEKALALMREKGHLVRSVSIRAKRKVCPMPHGICEGDKCPRAKGYFDRQKFAVEESRAYCVITEEVIRYLADKYTLCPFELSLAIAQTCQVVICDYNYVFDPAVRLRRFFDHKGRYTLLIDETHNLPDRAREMYSAEIGDKDLRELRRAVGNAEGRKCGLYLSLTAALKSLGKTEECELRSELPVKVSDALKSFMDEAKPYLGKAREYSEQLTDLYFSAAAFVRVSGEYDEECYKTMVSPEGKTCRVRLWCWSPTSRLEKIMKKMQGVIMFSATLSPINHYAMLLNAEERSGGKCLALPSPFPRKNLLALRLDIPTRYSKREESMMSVVRAIAALAQSRKGNYLACFPSHAYLNQAAQVFASVAPDADILLQNSRMSDSEREAYLGRFLPDPPRSMVAFIAMGGVFSEGVDLPGDLLTGAVIVGVGLPQICFERDALKILYDNDEGEGGFETAYVYPGIGKCLQAAGRVIRTETDRSVVLFVDDRYSLPEYACLLPKHMKPKRAELNELPRIIKEFWNKTEGTV